MADLSFEVDPQTFTTDVVERSRQQPVLLLFWADQVPESAQARAMLEQLVAQYAGKVLLGHVDVARDPTLAQHLRVQGLPSLRVVADGQIVDQADGPLSEAQYRELLDRLTMSSSDQLKLQLDSLLEAGQFDVALDLLQRAIAEEPNNQAFRVELADVLVRSRKLDDARQVLATIPDDTPERGRPQARLEIAEEADGLTPLAELERQLAGDDVPLDVRYEAAVRYADAGDAEAALEQALAILVADRKFRDDIGRLTMLRIFDMLGKGSELASRYRRRMFNFMH